MSLDSYISSNRARAELAYQNASRGSGLNPEYVSTVQGQKPKDYVDGTGIAFGSYPVGDGLVQKVQWNDNTDRWDDFGDPVPTQPYTFRTVEGFTDLRNISTNKTRSVRVQKPDKKSGIFVPYLSDPVGNGDDGGVVVQSSNGGWWVRQKFIEESKANVRWFGAEGDGSTDDTSAIQSAIDAIESYGGGTVFFPANRVYFSSAATITNPGVSLIGEDWSSVLKRGNSSQGAIYYDQSAENVVIQNLAFDARSVDDFDSAIELWDSNGPVTITNCKFFDSNKSTQGGWTIDALLVRGVDDLNVSNCIGDGIQFKLAGGSSVDTKNVEASGNILRDATAYGISCVVSDNATLKNVDIHDNIIDNFNRGGIFVGRDGDSSTGVSTGSIHVYNNILITGDRSEGDTRCILCREGDQNGKPIRVVNNYLKGRSSSSGKVEGIAFYEKTTAIIKQNVLIGPFDPDSIIAQERKVEIIGNYIKDGSDGSLKIRKGSGIISNNVFNGEDSSRVGLFVENANNLTISENLFRQISSGSFTGSIDASSDSGETSNVIIKDNKWIDSPNLENAIRVRNDGSFDGIKIVDNDFRGAVSAFSGGSDPEQCTIRHNQGFKTRNKGQTTLSSGTTSTTVTHGLDLDSSPEDIYVTPTSTLGSASEFWVTNASGGNFDISVDTDPTQDITFVWVVDIGG